MLSGFALKFQSQINQKIEIKYLIIYIYHRYDLPLIMIQSWLKIALNDFDWFVWPRIQGSKGSYSAGLQLVLNGL